MQYTEGKIFNNIHLPCCVLHLAFLQAQLSLFWQLCIHIMPGIPPADSISSVIIERKWHSTPSTSIFVISISSETSTLLEFNRIIQGDSLTALKSIPDSCVNLIFTSPPYVDNREKIWVNPCAKNMLTGFRHYLPSCSGLLKNGGTFILNTKERAEEVSVLLNVDCHSRGYLLIDIFKSHLATWFPFFMHGSGAWLKTPHSTLALLDDRNSSVFAQSL